MQGTPQECARSIRGEWWVSISKGAHLLTSPAGRPYQHFFTQKELPTAHEYGVSSGSEGHALDLEISDELHNCEHTKIHQTVL